MLTGSQNEISQACNMIYSLRSYKESRLRKHSGKLNIMSTIDRIHQYWLNQLEVSPNNYGIISRRDKL